MNFSKDVIPPTNKTATPIFTNINIRNVYSDAANFGWYIDGLDESAFQYVSLENIRLENTTQLIYTCDNIYGFCDNSTVSPYCPPCLQREIIPSTTIGSNSTFKNKSNYYVIFVFILIFLVFL